MRPIKTITLNPAFDMHYYMEHFEAEKENYVSDIVCDAGGKGINTSRALKVNGIASTAYVILGTDNGATFETQLKRQGIAYVPLYAEGRIRENITLHPQDAKETRVSLDTFSLSEEHLKSLAARMEADGNANALISFSGRLPKGLSKEHVKSFLRDLIKAGAKLVVDTNSLTPDDLREIHPWFIKPNEEEIRAFLDRALSSPEDTADAARDLVLRGVAEQVMISLGGAGAVFSDGKRKFLLSVPRLDNPVSTIGAGDSVIAGFLAGNAHGLDLETSLRLAATYGTAACLTAGTLPPLPDDVNAVFSQVRVTALP